MSGRADSSKSSLRRWIMKYNDETKTFKRLPELRSIWHSWDTSYDQSKDNNTKWHQDEQGNACKTIVKKRKAIRVIGIVRCQKITLQCVMRHKIWIQRKSWLCDRLSTRVYILADLYWSPKMRCVIFVLLVRGCPFCALHVFTGGLVSAFYSPVLHFCFEIGAMSCTKSGMHTWICISRRSVVRMNETMFVEGSHSIQSGTKEKFKSNEPNASINSASIHLQ